MTHAATWLRERSVPTQVATLLTANVLLVACSQLSVHLPFTPVPITLQTFGVVLIGMLLGKKYGTAVVAAYLAEGLAGLPVFADWMGGPAKLLGPTGGYLLAFLPAVFVVGMLVENLKKRTWLKLAAAAVIGEAIILAIGTVWAGALLGWSNAVLFGFLPFVPGTFVKVAAAATLGRKA
jgi:biotin transport system substrate-specific component